MSSFWEAVTYLMALGLCLFSALTHADNSLSLQQAIALAHTNDPWLVASQWRQQALEAQSVSAGSLPDPQVSLGLLNLPVDTFNFNQEPMTQFKVSVSQMFPRGDSLALQRQQLQLQSLQQPFQRQDRQATVALTVTQLWLDAWQARETIALIEKNRALFEHLVDVAQAGYAAALGKTRQQDVIRAQLELTRLEDRLTVLNTVFETALAQLGEWLEDHPSRLSLAADLPDIQLIQPNLESLEHAVLIKRLTQHPMIKNLDHKINSSRTGIDLAKQRYKPQWGVNVGYAYRDETPMGEDRADFFSLGVTFDVPLFTAKRQDKTVQSAVANTEAVKTEKSLALRNMLAALETAQARLKRLEQRQSLYQAQLLRQMHEQAEASLTAYTHDDGDFAEVVRARIAELNAQVDALEIDVARLKTIAQLNYFLTQSEADTPGAQP